MPLCLALLRRGVDANKDQVPLAPQDTLVDLVTNREFWISITILAYAMTTQANKGIIAP